MNYHICFHGDDETLTVDYDLLAYDFEQFQDALISVLHQMGEGDADSKAFATAFLAMITNIYYEFSEADNVKNN